MVSCVDHDSARLAATALATVFCKPLLDIATGIHGSGADREMGADVRLVLPGQCLLCCGGLRDQTSALQVLARAEAERGLSAQRDWRHERAGSLASLNQCAVGVALRLLEDVVAARIQDSTWDHLAFTPAGALGVTYPALSWPGANFRWPPCRLSGWSEAELPCLVDLWGTDSPSWATLHAPHPSERIEGTTRGGKAQILGEKEDNMAPPARGKIEGIRQFAADPRQRHGSRRVITTLEHVIGGLQQLFGPEDTLIVAVACQLLSTSRASFLADAAWRDMGAFEEEGPVLDCPSWQEPGCVTPSTFVSKKGGDRIHNFSVCCVSSPCGSRKGWTPAGHRSNEHAYERRKRCPLYGRRSRSR